MNLNFFKHNPKESYYPSENKRFNDIVVFVHFFAGNQRMLKRHIQYVNSIGFDAVGFDLSFHSKWILKKKPISRTKNIGIRYIWGDEIEDVLNHYSGKKILFAFSNPCASSFDAIVRRNSKDITAMICDSGPFVKMINCSYNLVKYHFKVKNPILRTMGTAGIFTGWGVLHNHSLKTDLQKLPQNFPILSIRAWQDKLVPLSAIEKAFENHDHLDIQVLNLPDSGHLDGFKTSEDMYKDKVKNFLETYSSPL